MRRRAARRRRIVSAGVERIAAQQPPDSQSHAHNRTARLNRIDHVLRTGRLESALRSESGEQRRQHRLISAQQDNRQPISQSARRMSRAGWRGCRSPSLQDAPLAAAPERSSAALPGSDNRATTPRSSRSSVPSRRARSASAAPWRAITTMSRPRQAPSVFSRRADSRSRRRILFLTTAPPIRLLTANPNRQGSSTDSPPRCRARSASTPLEREMPSRNTASKSDLRRSR